MGGHINKEMVSQMQYTITRFYILVRKSKINNRKNIEIQF